MSAKLPIEATMMTHRIALRYAQSKNMYECMQPLYYSSVHINFAFTAVDLKEMMYKNLPSFVNSYFLLLKK
jgi:hypothetical protein